MSNDEVFFFVSFPAALTMSNFVRYVFVFLTKILTFSIASWCLCDNAQCSNAHYEHFFLRVFLVCVEYQLYIPLCCDLKMSTYIYLSILEYDFLYFIQ